MTMLLHKVILSQYDTLPRVFLNDSTTVHLLGISDMVWAWKSIRHGYTKGHKGK